MKFGVNREENYYDIEGVYAPDVGMSIKIMVPATEGQCSSSRLKNID
jgi:hypothetical protein